MDTNKAIMHTIIIIAVALAMHHIATCTLATCMTRYNRNFMYQPVSMEIQYDYVTFLGLKI